MSKKILDNIEPYNDIYYHSCFFHAMFPVIMHFVKDIRSFICNNIFAYDYQMKGGNNSLGIKAVTRMTIRNILDDIGIGANMKILSNNIVDDLICSINKGNPAIILTECYYQSLRPDMFEKIHVPHSLLIYGYNNEQSAFNIIEHNFQDSYIFEKRTIS